jgi:hypothetical protein
MDMAALRIATARPIAPDHLDSLDHRIAPYVRETVDREVREQVDEALRRQLAALLARSSGATRELPRAA